MLVRAAFAVHAEVLADLATVLARLGEPYADVADGAWQCEFSLHARTCPPSFSRFLSLPSPSFGS